MSKNFLQTSKLLGLCTKGSRVLGLIRDNLCGRLFGTSPEFGAFTIAFRTPNLFRRLFGEGALSAAFIPQFAQSLEEDNKKEAHLFANTVLSTTTLFLSLVSLIGILCCFGIQLWADLSPKWIFILKFTSILLPYLIFICITALLGSILNVYKHFLTPALAPILFNTSYIIGLIIAAYALQSNYDRLLLLCVVILVSGFLQMLMLSFTLWKKKWVFQLCFHIKSERFIKLWKQFLPVTFGMAIFQINVLLDALIANGLAEDENAVAALYYSDRIQQLPLGIISISIATAVYPLLAKYHSQKKWHEFQASITKALRCIWFLSLPSLIGIIALRTELVTIFFAFDKAESINSTSMALSCYAIGIIASCSIPILTRSFYACNEVKLPVRIGVFMVLLNISLNIILIKTTNLQGAAIALATSLSAILNFFSLLWFGHKKHQMIKTSEILQSLKGFVTPSCLLILILFFIQTKWLNQNAWVPISNRTPLSIDFLKVTIGVPMGIFIYLMSSWLLKTKELKELLNKG